MASVAITFEMPDNLAREADAAGLLSPEALRNLIEGQLRRKAGDRIRECASRGTKKGESPMSLAELQAIVAETRKVID
jgi:hypothetical protein